jgi:hypothetical protein
MIASTIPQNSFGRGESADIIARLSSDPALKSLKEEICTLEARKDSIDITLKLPRKERLSRFQAENPDGYYRIGNHEFEREKDMGMCVGVGSGLIGGAALVAGVLLGLIPSTVGSLLGSLAGLGGALVPFAYLKASKKWIIPRKIDRYAVGELSREQKGIERSLEYKKSLQSQAISRIIEEEKRMHPVVNIEEQDDFVIIGGIRLPKNPESEGGKAPADPVFRHLRTDSIPRPKKSSGNFDGTW